MHTLVIDIAKYLILVPPLVWLVVLAKLPKNQRWPFVVYTVIAGVITLLLMKLGATIYHDPRPFVRDGVHPYFTHAADNGFPSDHTIASSLLAFVVVRYRRYAGLALLVVALLIGTARVISGVHHGIDIVGAVAFAAIGAGLAVPLQRMVTNLSSKKERE